jgi:hypothetical protein
MRELLFEAFLALIECRHAALFVNNGIIALSYGLRALCTTGWGRQGNPLTQKLAVARQKKSAYVDCAEQVVRIDFGCERIGVDSVSWCLPLSPPRTSIPHWSHGTRWTLTNHGTLR